MLSEHHHDLTPPEDGFPFSFLLLRSPSSLITAQPAQVSCPICHSRVRGRSTAPVPGCQTPKSNRGDTAGVSTLHLSSSAFHQPKGKLSSHPNPSKPPYQRKLGREMPPGKGRSCPEPHSSTQSTRGTDSSPPGTLRGGGTGSQDSSSNSLNIIDFSYWLAPRPKPQAVQT